MDAENLLASSRVLIVDDDVLAVPGPHLHHLDLPGPPGHARCARHGNRHASINKSRPEEEPQSRVH